MNKDIEKRFIETFIVNNKKDRLLFELSGKQRRSGIARFSHDAQDLIKPERILYRGTDLFSDRIEALDVVLGNGMPAIIICDKLVIIETEQCFGTPMRYILI